MVARLVYKTDMGDISLEEMDLKELDNYIWKNYSSMEALENSKYKKKFKMDGSFKIAYDPTELPFSEISYYEIDDCRESKYLDIMFGQADCNKMLRDITDALDDIRIVRKVHDKYKEFLTSEENLYYHIGIVSNNRDYYLWGLGRLISERMKGLEGYLFIRTLRDFCIGNVKEMRYNKTNYVAKGFAC